MELSDTTIMAITLIVFLLLLVTSIPIAFCLFLAGILGMFLAQGPAILFSMGTTAFRLTYNWAILAVPLFVTMGEILVQHGIGEDLYDTTYKWVGSLKGGLAIASTWFCAAFGFMCGTSSAAAATIGGIAIPEMESRGYDRRLALGTLCCAGTLAVLIPPSGPMILYCITSGSSIGAVFMAGIIPGLILAALISFYVWIRCVINPRLGPVGEKVSWSAKIRGLFHLIPVIILVLAVLGSIYFGVCSAIEAGAVGAVVATIICIAYRRFAWSKMKHALAASVRISGFIYMIIIGANVFVYVFYLTGFQAMIQDMVLGLNMPGWAVIVLIGLILMVLGTFLDVVAMIFITVPIFLPIAQALGFSDVWFGIVMILFCEMALITPPVAVNLYVILGVAPKGTTLFDVSAGAVPYVAVIWVMFVLVTVFPQLALWLPSTMR